METLSANSVPNYSQQQGLAQVKARVQVSHTDDRNPRPLPAAFQNMH